MAIVAHDFRKPLMAIRGFAELVLEEPDIPVEARQEFMRTVISETEQLALLANDTLLITQIETGQFELQLERGGPRPLHPRHGADGAVRPLGAPRHPAPVPDASWPTPTASARSSRTSR